MNEKMSGERKSAPKQHAKKEWLTEEGIALVAGWVQRGITQREIAKKIGVTEKTICEWKNECPEFRRAIERSREVTDLMVENALLKAALGYKVTETKTIISGKPDAQGNRRTRVEQTVKDIGPSTTACITWLINRKPKEWKRNRDNELEVTDENNNITINIVKHQKEEEAEDWNED